MGGRLFRLVWGDDVDPALRGLLAAFFSTTLAFSAFWSFAGIWAIERLGASSAELGLTFLGDAILSAASGFLGGHLSDRLGRKPGMLFSLGGQCLVAAAFLASSAVGFALGPLASLQLRGASGDDAMWIFLAAVFLAAATVGVVAVRVAHRRPATIASWG